MLYNWNKNLHGVPECRRCLRGAGGGAARPHATGQALGAIVAWGTCAAGAGAHMRFEVGVGNVGKGFLATRLGGNSLEGTHAKPSESYQGPHEVPLCVCGKYRIHSGGSSAGLETDI